MPIDTTFKSKTILWIVAALTLLLTSAVIPASAGHGQKIEMKKGILLVTFGTSKPKAAKVYETIDAAARKRFPGIEIRWAYTASTIRAKLIKRGQMVKSPAQAMADMAADGITHLAVQSLHIIPGHEFDDLKTTCRAMASIPKGFQHIELGKPLLTSPQDLEKVSAILLNNLPTDRKPDQAVIYMGHGTNHPANAAYQAMAYNLQQLDSNIFVGTVEGYPSIDGIALKILKTGLKTAWLVPMMSVAGDHAMNDMAGPENDSWKSVLEAKGVQCRPIMKGMAEYPRLVDIWLDHLDDAIYRLQTLK